MVTDRVKTRTQGDADQSGVRRVSVSERSHTTARKTRMSAQAKKTAVRKTLADKIKDKSANIGIVGLGYVGLPLAAEFASQGFTVTGFDISKAKVNLINSGKSDIDDVPSSKVAELVKAGRLKATADPKLISKMDTISICVPTPLSKTKDPDISYILAALEWVVKHLHKDMLVVLESTTYPGTTDEVIQPAKTSTWRFRRSESTRAIKLSLH